MVTSFDSRGFLVGSVESVESLEGSSGPHDESSEMSAWCELQEVQFLHIAQLHSRDVSEGANERRFGFVDDQGTSSLCVAAVSRLTVTTAEFARVFDLFNVSESVDGLEEFDGRRSLSDLQNSFVGDNQWNLWDLLHSVSSSQHKSS